MTLYNPSPSPGALEQRAVLTNIWHQTSALPGTFEHQPKRPAACIKPRAFRSQWQSRGLNWRTNSRKTLHGTRRIRCPAPPSLQRACVTDGAEKRTAATRGSLSEALACVLTATLFWVRTKTDPCQRLVGEPRHSRKA